jgi:hypothetical protein
MALDNAAELSAVLAQRERLGKVFARHAYGMRAWVDLFSSRIAAIDDPRLKVLVATLVADNARHMLLFRERAAAVGVDPDAYACPPEGEAIYERIPELGSVEEALGYALGSLEHFDELLGVYRTAASGDDAAAIDSVRVDVRRMCGDLRASPAAQQLAAEAHERYRVRELVETPLYAYAA